MQPNADMGMSWLGEWFGYGMKPSFKTDAILKAGGLKAN